MPPSKSTDPKYPEGFNAACEAKDRQERLDVWAGMAMQALVTGDEVGRGAADIHWSPPVLAAKAYVIAEALEAERTRRMEGK